MTVTRMLGLVCGLLSLGVVNQAPQTPRVELNPSRAHVSVYAPSHWDIRLYGAPDLSGPAIVRLDDEGLFAGGKKACAWPGGRWDRARAANMVLGYATTEASGYGGCHPGDLPILSTWGDRGVGTAALYIEVVARQGHLVETDWRGQRLYLDLNSLPGDPREALPGVQLQKKGFVGWEWMVPSDPRSAFCLDTDTDT